MKNYLSFLLAAVASVSCLADNVNEVLLETKTKLDAIKSVSYLSRSRGWYPYQEEDERPFRDEITFEVDDPSEPYAGCHYVTTKSNGDISMCYDGKYRMCTNVMQQGTYEIDSLFHGFDKFRPILVPFYHCCRRMVDYALQPTDSIALSLSEDEHFYTVDLIIYGQDQVDFALAIPDSHLPEEVRKHCEDPTSHYTLKIDRQTMLPVEYFRDLSHQCSREAILNKPRFSDVSADVICCYAAIPEGYTEYLHKSFETGTTQDLVGQQAPVWKLCDEDGKEMSLDLGNGKRKLLMFTGIGCGPCKVAIPFVNSIYDRGDVEVIAMECWQNPAKNVKLYREHEGIKYPLLVGGDEVMRLYHFDSVVPQFIVISEQGKIEALFQGWCDATGDKIRELLK